MNGDSLRRAMVVRGSKSHHHPRYKKVTVLLAKVANEVICNARSHITKNAATTIQRLVREWIVVVPKKSQWIVDIRKKSSSNTTHALTSLLIVFTSNRLPINF